MHRQRTRLAGGALVAFGLFAAATAPAPPAGADSEAFQSFGAVAAADGLRVTWTAPGAAVVDTPVDSGGPSAQATLDSLGTSTAFASHPFPGSTAVAGPGTVSGFTGVTGLPEYPFYVNSAHPAKPDGAVSQPGYTIEAHSDATTSRARALSGVPGDGTAVGVAAATAETTRSDSSVTAVAVSRVDAFAAGPVVISGFVSQAQADRNATGQLQRQARVQVGRLELAGTPVGLTEDGLVLPGTTVKLPDASPVWAALAESGTTVQVLRRTETADGLLAPGLVIRTILTPPGGGAPMTVTFTMGRGMASVAGQPAGGVALPPEIPSGSLGVEPAGPEADSTAVTGSTPASVTPVVSPPGASVSGSAGTGASGLVSEAQSAAASAPAGSPAPTEEGAVAAATPVSATVPPMTSSVSIPYLVVAAIGVLMLAGVEAIRLVGVRS